MHFLNKELVYVIFVPLLPFFHKAVYARRF